MIADLPPVHIYWAHEKIRPKEEALGFSSPNAMFEKYIEGKCRDVTNRPVRFLSIGSGNCDVEISLAQKLRAHGHTRFVIECLDLNPAMLERGRAAALAEGVSDQVNFVEADFNAWRPEREYDAIMANQVLHHVVNLEGLFREIHNALAPDGQFLISDMIGRNGHMLWPEAFEIVQEYWQRLPAEYKYNLQLKRHEELLENWDCSRWGFEGIRAQDILPLLIDNFHFQIFCPFGNIIDPFVSRAFGHHFDVTSPRDLELIDEIHLRDDREMALGWIKPTHMVAVVGKDHSVPSLFNAPLTPEFCVRRP